MEGDEFDALGAALKAAMDQIDATLRPPLEAADELRQQLAQKGFPAETAASMAGEYYKTVMAIIRSKL